MITSNRKKVIKLDMSNREKVIKLERDLRICEICFCVYVVADIAIGVLSWLK